MTATIWGNLNLLVKCDTPIYHDVVDVNEQLWVNNRVLIEHDIWIDQVDQNTFEISTVVSYNPSAQTEDEAFKEAIDTFGEIDMTHYYIEDLCSNLTKTTVQTARFNWEEFENPELEVFM